MRKLWEAILNGFNYLGDRSGCHQMPQRCFLIKGYTFPLCARCTGTMVGQAAAVILLFFGKVTNIYLSIAMMAVMGLDWFIQWMKWKESTNFRRFVTGILGGFGLLTLYIHIGIWMFNSIKALFI